jgi:hypothetical protein
MKKKIFTFTILLFSACMYGQIVEKPDIYEFPIPKTLEKCFSLLNKTMPDNEIQLIKTLQEDSIYYHPEFKYRTDFFHAWKIYNGSDLTKYFNKKGLFGSFEIYETILVSYHRYLNGDDINLEEQITKYTAIQEKEHEEYLLKVQQDSIKGVYIPTDLKDCFMQLDKVLSEEDKDEIRKLKNKEETIAYHLGFGMWLRNNWGLWGGSRLQKYFLDRNIELPDSMSSLILEFYYEWLNGEHRNWQKWTKCTN